MHKIPILALAALCFVFSAQLSAKETCDEVAFGVELELLPLFSMRAVERAFINRVSPEANNPAFFNLTERLARTKNGSVSYVATGHFKALSQLIFRNRELAAGLMNIFKRLLIKKVRDQSVPGTQFYASYKGAAFGAEGVEDVRGELAPLYEAALLQFERVAVSNPHLAQLLSQLPHVSTMELMSVRQMFTLGSGRTFQQAAWCQKVARRLPPGRNGVIPPLDFASLEAQTLFFRYYRQIQSSLEAVVNGFRGVPSMKPILERHNAPGLGGPMIPTMSLMAVLRDSYVSGKTSFRAKFEEHFAAIFGFKPAASLIEPLFDLVEAGELFVSEILANAERTNLGIGDGVRPVVMVDGRGVGARNLYFAVKSLVLAQAAYPAQDFERLEFSARTRSADEILSLLGYSQSLASKELEATLSSVVQALRSATGVDGDLVISGDDLVFRPKEKATFSQVVAAARALERAGQAQDVRLILVDAPAEARNDLLDKFESLLKDPRVKYGDSVFFHIDAQGPAVVINGIVIPRSGSNGLTVQEYLRAVVPQIGLGSYRLERIDVLN